MLNKWCEMILPKEIFKALDEQTVEWEKCAEEYGGSYKDMSLLYKDFLKILKKSDKYGFVDISSILLFVIQSINDGPETTNDLASLLCDYMQEIYGLREEGETGIVNNDGSYLKFEQLEKEIEEKEKLDMK